jgi:hypothetical protein
MHWSRSSNCKIVSLSWNPTTRIFSGDCFEYADCGDEFILKDNTDNKNSSCCIDARDQLIDAYHALTAAMAEKAGKV